MNYPASMARAVKNYWLARLRPVSICLDADMRVLSVEGDLAGYGFPPLKEGQDAASALDFLVGLDKAIRFELPLVESPGGHPVSVHVFPDKGNIDVLIFDAARDHQQQQMLHQKANEVQLLSERQERLMYDLELARAELEATNEALRQTAKLQNSFVSNMSHEFGTPLSAILGYANLMLRPDADASVFRKNAKVVSRAAKYLLSLVENLLDYGRLEAEELIIQPKKTRLHQLFSELNEMFIPLANEKSLDFHIDLDLDEALCVEVDPTRLRQCLINVIGNAIKFTSKGAVRVGANYSDGVLNCVVEDTGRGMSQQDLDRIFMSYWRSDDVVEKGSGLGMTIVKRLMHLMGGNVRVESRLGQGTKVHLVLPALQLDEAESVISEPVGIVDRAHAKVLLVEDDTDISELLTIYLEEAKCVVDTVADGSEALRRVLDRAYDLVLLDLNLPGMSGFDILERIGGQTARCPVIAMSASGLDSDRRRALRAGADRFLLKPVGERQLINLIKELLESD